MAKDFASGSWPPDYTAVFCDKAKTLDLYREDPRSADAYYSENPLDWIEHFCLTYDPRNAKGSGLTWMPFVLFKRQKDMVSFLVGAIAGDYDGLIEKCRDVGATWVCCAFSVWLWLYRDGAAIGWGSRKQELVDQLGDPKCIFEKMRQIIDNLPHEMLPRGFSRKDHCTFMKIINPENGSSIVGESGDNIGRGGRTLVYFKDESAHYERPEKIEAALGDNTNCQIDISSVNGTGNVFHRRRRSGVVWSHDVEIEQGATAVFVMDWRDHPAKTQEWYDRRKRQWASKGLAHVFAQEVDRDYAASVDGVLIPASWVSSSIDAHVKLDITPTGALMAALDVADEGGDTNALTIRHGILIQSCDDWGEGDTTQTAHRAVKAALAAPELYYDSIGVGAGVKGATNEMARRGELPSGMKVLPWSASAAVINPDGYVIQGEKNSPKNKDFYLNLKSQAWWMLRRRFEETHKAVSGGDYDPDALISIPNDLPKRHQLCDELSQPTYSRNAAGKIVIDKKPDGMKSPNLADSVVMAYWPCAKPSYTLDYL